MRFKRFKDYLEQYWQTIGRLEKWQMRIAWALPRWLVKWAAVRLICNATTGQYSNQVVPELTAMDALQRW